MTETGPVSGGRGTGTGSQVNDDAAKERQGRATGGAPLEEHNVRATFADGKAARAAVVALERRGIESGDVTVVESHHRDLTGADAREEDMAATGDVAMRYGLGGAIGAVIGAIILVAIVNVVGIEPRAAASVGGALGGAFAGFFLGGYWGGASKLPVNDDVWDTYAPDVDGHVCVIVHVGRPERADTADEVLEGLDPVSVERLDRQGNRI